MRLRYLKGESTIVHWIDTSEFTEFSPEGETTDERGQRLLDNPKYKGWFEAVVVSVPATHSPSFECTDCGKSFKSKAALGSHKRKHKEIST